MGGGEPDEHGGEALARHFPADRAAALHAELGGRGLVAVPAEELAALRERSRRYERLRALVEGPAEPPPE